MSVLESDLADMAAQQWHPIADYGVIGDCRTAALVGPDGSIDWACLPHFDSPAVFLRMLDDQKGGYFQVCPDQATRGEMRYRGATNILTTTFTTPEGTVDLIDFMPIRQRHQPTRTVRDIINQITTSLRSRKESQLQRIAGNDVAAAHRISRLATVTSGTARLNVTVKPTFDFARQMATMTFVQISATCTGAILSAGNQFLVLVVRELSDGMEHSLWQMQDTRVVIDIPMREGERAVILLNYARSLKEARQLLSQLDKQDVDADLRETTEYWENWAARCSYDGPYRDIILRSALALKLCTFEPTGAIVAAPTMALPEEIGGVRNWDYRYTWLRDSAFTIEALGQLGYFEEAHDFFHFIYELNVDRIDNLRIMYSITGASDDALAEKQLTYLSGYQHSHPVRLGNGAALQCQMDVYGELLDAVYRYALHNREKRFRVPITAYRRLNRLVTRIANYVCDHWQDIDNGIWEVRGPQRAFVYSRTMCWVALDRACKLIPRGRATRRWQSARAALQQDILTNGYNPDLHAFSQYYHSSALDSANLRLPLVGFIDVADERMRGTIQAIQHHLTGKDGLLYRYQQMPSDSTTQGSDDGLTGSEGAFIACTLWLIENLCALGRVDEAEQQFQSLLTYASPLGLYSEEIDPEQHVLLGNYPQAFTHIGLINAAVTITRARQQYAAAPR